MKAFAKYKLDKGMFESAIKDLAGVVKESMDDVDAIASLVLAYSHVDLEKAQQYIEYLPQQTDQECSLDIDHLETGIEFITSKHRVVKETAVIKKKRKRRGKLPKDLTTRLDPERWLPKHERSSNKKGRKDLNKGPQGVNMAGGGVGQTGSAKIGLVKASMPVVEAAAPIAKPLPSKKGKKKRK